MAEAVVAVEEDAALAQDAETQLATAEADNVAVVSAALTEGASALGPFDVILMDGAVERLPATITDQLKKNGRIAALFMDGPLGTCRIGHKYDGHITWRDAFNATAEILPGFQKEPAFQL
jgi:protein-L-isoaspartate(D-aspartate) O-methyltransferase